MRKKLRKTPASLLETARQTVQIGFRAFSILFFSLEEREMRVSHHSRS